MSPLFSTDGGAVADASTPTSTLPGPDIQLPVVGPAFQRANQHLIEQLYKVSSATASATLHNMGIRRTFIQGPQSRQPGAKTA